jgi:hypothetical protein
MNKVIADAFVSRVYNVKCMLQKTCRAARKETGKYEENRRYNSSDYPVSAWWNLKETGTLSGMTFSENNWNTE